MPRPFRNEDFDADRLATQDRLKGLVVGLPPEQTGQSTPLAALVAHRPRRHSPMSIEVNGEVGAVQLVAVLGGKTRVWLQVATASLPADEGSCSALRLTDAVDLRESETSHKLWRKPAWYVDSEVISREATINVDDLRNAPATHDRVPYAAVIGDIQDWSPDVDPGETVGCSPEATLLLLEGDSTPRKVVTDEQTCLFATPAVFVELKAHCVARAGDEDSTGRVCSEARHGVMAGG